MESKFVKAETIKEIKLTYDKITQYSEIADLDSFLSYYDNSQDFLHISGDGQMRNYEAYKIICADYYKALKKQNITTVQEKIQLIETNLAVMGWSGNIIANFKNGDKMIMNNYSITSLFKKIDGKWKIIHAHESSLPSEIIHQTVTKGAGF